VALSKENNGPSLVAVDTYKLVAWSTDRRQIRGTYLGLSDGKCGWFCSIMSASVVT